MRRRLTIILYVPSVLLLLVLGLAYAESTAGAQQQRVYVDRLADASYLVRTARQSLLSDDPSVVSADLNRYHHVYGVRAAVVDASGRDWAGTGLDATALAETEAALAGHRSEFRKSFLPWDVDQIVVAEPVYDGGDLLGAVVTVSDAERLARDIWLNWGMLIAGVVLVLALAVVVADRTARWVLGPVRAVDHAMTDVGRGDLAARIPSSAGPPELRQVVEHFNDMSDQVERLVRKQQQFVANASHELRNPLNALMLRVDALVESAADADREDAEFVRAEARRLANILDALLLLADDAAPHVETEVEVSEVIRGRVESWRQLTRGRPIRGPEPARDPARAVVGTTALESAFDAVMDNAVKYSPAGAPIEVSVHTDDGVVEVAVRDHGPGVPAQALGRMTERFWRGPQRTGVSGSGLGLSIASELLAPNGGELVLGLASGGGLEARIRLPRNGDGP
ncbi:sensor histidine kinase [Georgenia deserti]|uniref:histidine kinase n=1 Tax=Georgenia deserti TaxID=2093781 RepID=A0ABW4L9A6_9MICO